MNKETKWCYKCDKVKVHNEFSKHRTRPDGLQSTCRPCQKAYIQDNKEHISARNKAYHEANREQILAQQRAYRKANPNIGRNAKLKNKYGITLGDYNRILENQNHSCKICGTTNSGRRGTLDVDHCHTTGKVRGLLCTNCNNGLGRFKDSADLLASAIKYLNAKGYRC